MSRPIPFSRFVVAALLIVTLAFTIPASARSGESSLLLSGTVPTQVFPTGSIPIKHIIYIWTPVDGASQYELQVYQSSTQVLDQMADASVCVSGTCSVMPALDLAAGSYNWRIRAMVSGVYQAFSPWFAFTVVAEPTGFLSLFTTEMNGWVPHKGSWVLASSNFLATTGVAGKAATISHTGSYSTLTFEARMKRSGCAGCVNVLAIRGNPVLDSVGWWNTEYTFDYTNNGLFSVWKDNNGTYTALKTWTSTSAIDQGGWNVLRVTASGSTLKFYINGYLVWSGTDSAYSSGRVGIGMYRNFTSTGDKLWVDYAQLNTTVTSAPQASAAEMIPEDQVEVPGGSHNMAP